MAHIRDDLSTGRRLYVETAYGEPIVDRLKELGCHWDREQRCWWISPKKRTQVEDLLVDSDQKKESGAEPEQKTERPGDVRLVGKCRYKGQTYYCRFYGPTKRGYSARLVTLPDAQGKFLDFWAEAASPEQQHLHDGSTAVAVLVKTYEPREVWDGRRYSGRTRTEYTTLGSIARFIARQKNPATRRVQCYECDSWYDEGDHCRECGGC